MSSFSIIIYGISMGKMRKPRGASYNFLLQGLEWYKLKIFK